MSGSVIGAVILWLIVAVIVIAIIVYLVNWLYRRSTKEVSFVRTGLGGEKVVINGGAFVLPIVHETTPVNMNVVQLEVVRDKENALITKDRMRVDMVAEFYVRVAPTREAVSSAAATLGRRTMEHNRLHELLSGKFIGALRSVGAEMTLEEMHERRGDYVVKVKAAASEALALNGLELESVAITELDQTDLEYFNPSNRFDAEGLTRLIEEIETRRKTRNDIEQDTMVRIRARNLEAEKQTLEIECESETARLDQERDVEVRRAAQRADLARERARRETEAEQAEILAREETEKARIANEEALNATRIAAEQTTRQRDIDRTRAIEAAEIDAREEIEKTRIAQERAVTETRIASEEETQRLEIERKRAVEEAEIAAQQETERARIARERTLAELRIAQEEATRRREIERTRTLEEAEIGAAEATERSRIASDRGLDEARVNRDRDLRHLEIERDRAVELTEIDKAIALLEKSKERSEARIESEAARAKAVRAEEQVETARDSEIANRRREVELMLAQKDAEEQRIVVEVDRIRAAVEAEAQRLLNEAENVLTDEARLSVFRRNLLDRVEGIVRESVRPMEKIDGINILHVDGLAGAAGGGRNMTDEVIDSALRYRVQAPLIDSLLGDLGMEGGSLAKMGGLIREARDLDSIRRSVQARDKGAGGDGKKSED